MSARHFFTLLVFAALAVGLALDRSAPRPVPAPLIELPEPLELGLSAPVESRTLRGRLLGPDGAGIAEAALIHRGARGSSWCFTDAEGSFELRGAPLGACVLDCLAWPWMPLAFEVGSGEPDVELRIQEDAPEVLRLEPFERADLRGVVRDAAGDPVPGTEVVAVPTTGVAESTSPETGQPPESPPTWLTGRMPRRAVAGADGSFVFEGLITGAYRLGLRPAWAQGGSWPELLAESDRDLVHSAEADNPGLVLATTAGGVRGRVVDTQENPVEGALLILRSTENRNHLWPPDTTDPDGRFEIDELPSGRYDLELLAGDASLVLAEISVTAGASTELELTSIQPEAATEAAQSER